jgi:hypothetical protein
MQGDPLSNSRKCSKKRSPDRKSSSETIRGGCPSHYALSSALKTGTQGVDYNEALLPVLFFSWTKQGNRYAQQDKKETHKTEHKQR